MWSKIRIRCISFGEVVSEEDGFFVFNNLLSCGTAREQPKGSLGRPPPNSAGLKRCGGVRPSVTEPCSAACYRVLRLCQLLVQCLLCYFAAPECSAHHLRPRVHERSAHLVFRQLQHHGWHSARHIATPGKESPVRYPARGVPDLLPWSVKSQLLHFILFFI